MIIAIDIDGVCRDFVSSITKTYKQYWPHHEVKPIDHWYFHDCFPIGEGVNDLYEFLCPQQVFYDNAPIFPGVKEGLDKLFKKHHIVALTHQSKTGEGWTREWIRREGLEFDEIEVVNSGLAKAQQRADVIIDDCPSILEYLSFNHPGHIFCMNRPYNIKKRLMVTRVDTFLEFVTRIEVGPIYGKNRK